MTHHIPQSAAHAARTTDVAASSALQVLGTPDRQLRITTALPLQTRRSGWLLVDDGPVWITRSGDSADHVLGAGQAIHLGPGQRLVAEPWHNGRAARLRWTVEAPQAAQPDLAGLAALPVLPAAGAPGLLAAGWRLLAWGLRGAAWRFAAAARSAESRASSAQGRISAGDSIASSGALQ